MRKLSSREKILGALIAFLGILSLGIQLKKWTKRDLASIEKQIQSTQRQIEEASKQVGKPSPQAKSFDLTSFELLHGLKPLEGNPQVNLVRVDRTAEDYYTVVLIGRFPETMRFITELQSQRQYSVESLELLRNDGDPEDLKHRRISATLLIKVARTGS